jgi:exopolyphosphatase / guanosine-5'-triphosphate,3'-diphosphate pyrophosphatase
MRIAAIDIGTNSIHMVIAQSTQGAGFEVVEREREVVQIGRGSFDAGRLVPDAIRRTTDALSRFVQLARRMQTDRILCTATAAVRESKNGGEFLRAAREISGVTPRVIPGEEEGRLIYLAVRRALQLDDEPALMIDIGGGSMQLVVGDRDRMQLATGAPLGALRLREMILESDPPTNRELRELRRTVRKRAKGAIAKVLELEPTGVYGSSGSIHALAQAVAWQERGAAIEHMNGHVLPLEGLQRLTRELAHMDESERAALRGLDTKRAEIILPGAVVLQHVLEEVGADGITISDFGVREGLVIDYLERHAAEITALDKVQDVRLRSVYGLLRKFHDDERHVRHVAALSLALFDGLRREHDLPDEARDLLHYAALLHDLGEAIGHDGHAEHSRYVILNGNLRGLSAEQLALVANVARYHGASRPKKRDEYFRRLSKTQRRAVRWLAAMLRIAEGLDRSHYQLVKSLQIRRGPKSLTISAATRGDAQLEHWAAQERAGLLSRLVGMPVRIRRVEATKSKEAPPSRKGRRAGAPRGGEKRRAAASAGSKPPLAPRDGRAATGATNGAGTRAARRRRESSRGSAAAR